jgi:hypothetical protein
VAIRGKMRSESVHYRVKKRHERLFLTSEKKLKTRNPKLEIRKKSSPQRHREDEPQPENKAKYHHEGPSAAELQPKRKGRDHHEGHEEHEGRTANFIKKLYPNFVAFVLFVVKVLL